MRYQSIKRIMGLAAIVAALAWPSAARAQDDVLPGWVLFQTLPASRFAGTNWTGAPLGTFDFGSQGSQSVGAIDTIIQIQHPVTSSGPIQVAGVQLQTVNPLPANWFGPGTPAGEYFITLNTSQPSSGTFTIYSFPVGSTPGLFNTSFSVYFDVRYGSSNGPIVAPDQTLNLTIAGAEWSRNAPPGALELLGINYLLNGTDTSSDFWPVGVLHFIDPSDPNKEHIVIVPEPATGLLAVLGTGLWLMRRKLLWK